ncbi:MAG: alpha/beta hydrolase family protein [Nocardioides sp.]|nr:alpha/beta hydrolase family protein [Nocardioides sp.]
MGPTVRQVLDWQPHLLAGAADALVARRGRLLSLQAEIDDGRVPTGWYGDAADAARSNQKLLTGELDDLLAEVSGATRAIDVGGVATLDAQRILAHALADADREDFVVDRTRLAVTETRTEFADPHEQADRARRAEELAGHLRSALEAADHADSELARLLMKIAHSLVDGGHGSLRDADASGRGAGNRAIMEPPTGGLGDLNAWWRGLTPSEQRRVSNLHPDWIGNTDGIPGQARHLANVTRLEALRRTLLKLRGKAPGVEDKLADLRDIEALLETHHGDRQLLQLDASGPEGLRTVISLGDVDKARNVTVFVPGLGSHVRDKLGDYDAELDDLRSTMNTLSGHDENAAVLYLGVDTPQVDRSLFDLGSSSVVNDDLARAGADDLAGFFNGLDASRDTDPHLTGAGHSYGSLTLGITLTRSTGVDDAVYLGSPGLGVSDLAGLDVPLGHHYLLEARWDGISDLGMFGSDPSGLEGMHHLSTDAHQRLDLQGSHGHSGYLDDGSTSQRNLAGVGIDDPGALMDNTCERGEIDQAREEWKRVKELLGKATEWLR